MTVTDALPLLETRELCKQYLGNTALDGVCISARGGEVHAIVGANGAGKSTLMNILSGAIRPSGGSVMLEGQERAFDSPAEALSAGIACVYQELSLVPQLDVARNIFLGREPRSGRGTVDIRRLYEQTSALLDRFGLNVDPHAMTEALSVADQQLIELARALSMEPRVLILDEPTAVLSMAEKQNLFRIIRRLRDDGILVIYVSHFLGEVIEIADRVTVVRDGRLVGTHDARGMSVETLAEEITGDTGPQGAGAEPIAVSPDARALDIVLEEGGGRTELSINAGEILGIAGLGGSGRTAFARTLAGAGRRRARVHLSDGETSVSYTSVAKAIANGVVYLTEDRKSSGLFSSLSVTDNATASALKGFAALGLRRPRRERAAASELLDRLKVVAASPQMPITALSGGNQQKVMLARALLTRPRLLICDEPTRGVDIAAKLQIHRILRDLAHQGVAIILISSENEELLSLTDRLLIMQDGRLAGEIRTAETDESRLLVAISGSPKNGVPE
ncbi:MAG: sugar ABC transporter ATP-binding protein [Roseovarius sp.]|uniref:sugar ABC transporter ATP-binding protein n=1 Tax=Roseovarius sp. TaxID=1486281 RepID=UPI0032EB7295